MIRTAAIGNTGFRQILAGAFDQFQRSAPIKAHAALCRIHRFRNAETEACKIMTKLERFLPIDSGATRWIIFRKRISHNMCGGIDDARRLCTKRTRFDRRAFKHIITFAAMRIGQCDFHHETLLKARHEHAAIG